MPRKKNKAPQPQTLLEHLFGLKRDTALGAILIGVALTFTHYYDKWELYNQKQRQEVRHQVFQKFNNSRNTVTDNIKACLFGKKLSQNVKNKRITERETLVDTAADNQNMLPPDAFFTLIKYTHFDDSPAMQNLCSLDKKQLKWLKNQLLNIELKLGNQLNL